MFKKFLNKYFGSSRLFFSLLSFVLCMIIVSVSFFKQVDLTNAQVTLLLGALANAVAYVAVETIRKSE
jgi:hypothetical protein